MLILMMQQVITEAVLQVGGVVDVRVVHLEAVRHRILRVMPVMVHRCLCLWLLLLHLHHIPVVSVVVQTTQHPLV
jgi:hypothetical protein